MYTILITANGGFLGGGGRAFKTNVSYYKPL